jgi:predicted N-acetyltransferase YhbS
MVEIRLATSTDAEAIAQVVRSAWAGKVAADSSGHQETVEKVENDLGRGYAWLAEEEGRPVGTVRLTRHPHEIGVWEIKKLGVQAEYRKTGLGQQLMEAVLAKAMAMGAKEVRLAVRHDQPRLLEWYAQFGFVHDPKLRYSSPNPLTPLPFVMRKTLEVTS